MKPHRTRTSAERPSTRNASPNAAGTSPPRNCAAVARQRAKVIDSPPTITNSSTLRGARIAPSAAVTSGTTSVQTSSVTLPFQLGKTTDVHRLEPIDDPPDEHAEYQDRQNHVEEDPQLHDHRHAGGDSERNQEDGVLHGQQREYLADRLLARHHQEQPDHQRRQPNAEYVMRDADRPFGKARADAVPDDGQ